jgi:hypothetical protein
MGSLNTVQNGKGSKPRPLSNYQKFINNWDNIFSKKTVDLEKEICDNAEQNETKNSTRTKKKRVES